MVSLGPCYDRRSPLGLLKATHSAFVCDMENKVCVCWMALVCRDTQAIKRKSLAKEEEERAAKPELREKCVHSPLVR